MRIIWSPQAEQCLTGVFEYILEGSVQDAVTIHEALYAFPDLLTDFAKAGKEGRVKGTRELLHPKLPFFFVYEINNDAIHILDVWHTRQNYK